MKIVKNLIENKDLINTFKKLKKKNLFNKLTLNKKKFFLKKFSTEKVFLKKFFWKNLPNGFKKTKNIKISGKNQLFKKITMFIKKYFY